MQKLLTIIIAKIIDKKCMFKKISFATIAIILLCLPTAVFAQGNLNDAGTNLGKTATKAGTTEGDVGTIVGTIINAALTLVGIIFLVLMVYGGYLWMTARGNSEQVDKAKEIIIGALIGLVVIMSAYAITVFVTSRFEN